MIHKSNLSFLESFDIKNSNKVCGLLDNNLNVITLSKAFLKKIGFDKKHQLNHSIVSLRDYIRRDNEANFPTFFLMNYLNHLIKNSSNQVLAYVNRYSTGIIHLKHNVIQDKYNIKQFIYAEEMQIKKTINQNIIKNLNQKYNVNFFVLDNIFMDIKDLYSYICFGLIYGESLQDIANWLGISRSYVNKIITEKINPTLGIPGSSSKLLLEKLIHIEFYRYIPYNVVYSTPKNEEIKNSNQIMNEISNNLNDTQKKIISMLLNNEKQLTIAEEIGISRSYVSKIIHKQLFPMFNINSDNYNELIKILKSNSNTNLTNYE
jgi:hypothetical protein